MSRPLIFLLIMILVCSCSDQKHQAKSGKRAFYYWQTSLDNFFWDDSVYQSLQLQKVYARFFDVDWDKTEAAPVPVSPLSLNHYTNWPDSAQLVPVIFITNETFRNLDKTQSIELARNVYKKTMNLFTTLIARRTHPSYNGDYWTRDPYRVLSSDFREQHRHDSLYNAEMAAFREIQFDCDWTETTKDKYFAFLEESKKLFSGWLVTSTIRLYQYKYPDKAGVPPVQRGTLMCYNAGDIKNVNTRNSIFDKEEIKSYLTSGEYPIPLDYALPVFGWGVLFQEGKFRGILSLAALREDYASHVTITDDQRAIVNSDFTYGHTYSGIYVREGDEIRLEETDMNDVEEIAEWLSDHRNNADATLTLYHLNEYDLKKNSKEIESIFNSF